GATFRGYGVKSCLPVKDLCRVYNLCTVRDDGKKTEDQTKAVEKRRWTAEDVVRCESHPVANKSRVVDNVAAWNQSMILDVLFELSRKRTDASTLRLSGVPSSHW